jgi:DNA-binding transcriptional MerR regulator
VNSSEAVLAACGITERQLGHWVKRGYLTPRDRHRPMRGQPREFSDTELKVAALMARLVDRGFTPHAAAQIARATHGDGGLPVPNSRVTLGLGLSLLIEHDIDTGEDSAP